MTKSKIVLFVLIGVLFCSLLFGQEKTISDSQFFDALNLDYTGLNNVKACVKIKDYDRAKKEYVKYLKQRKTPVWFFDWTKKEEKSKDINVSIKEADRYANNELLSSGTWYQFGKEIDWTYNATNDNNEWTWQLNRHHFWVNLGKAYWKTDDEKYARAFVSQLNSWLDQCKKPNNSGNKAGSAWRTIEAGIRMKDCWPNTFYYFLSSPSFDDETVFKMVKSFYEHGKHLRKYNTSDNWLSIEMNGLYTVGVLFPEFKEASEWRNFAVGILYKEESEQFYPDGAQVELSPGYHSNSLNNIISVYRLASLNRYRLPSDYVLRLERVYELIQKTMMPDGKLPSINDSGWEESFIQLQNAANYFQKRKDFEYSATRGLKGKKPSYTSVWMPWAGWYVMRSGWDTEAFYALFEVGPYGTGHQHEDKLSFILSAYGSRLITECGKYAYDSSEWRKYSISARGHNVARVDGMDQNRALVKNSVSLLKTPLSNKFISNRRYDMGDGYYTEGFGDKGDKNVSHHRSLKFVKNKYWLLVDEFIPADNKEHTYDIWFHFNTDKYRVDNKNNVVYTNDSTAANIAIVRLGANNEVSVLVGEKEPEIQGWVAERSSEEVFSCRPVATPIYHNKSRGITKEHFVFIPFKKGVNTSIIEVRQLSSKKYRVYFDNINPLTIEL